jgi:hypothetical protein
MTLMRLIFGILLCLLISISTAEAHLAGQPPFFTINDEYSALYPVSITSTNQMSLPQDIAVKTHRVGETMQFNMEVEKLPLPLDIVQKTTFSWDFGDGTTAEGITNTHIYTTPGSYVLTIYADFSAVNATFEPQLMQSVLLHILPDDSYKLPQVTIDANGTLITDPIVDTVDIYGKEIRLKANTSPGTAAIKSVTWDIGDGNIATKAAITHTYSPNRQYYFPFVRVIDANGFMIDAYVELNNAEPARTEQLKTKNVPYLIILIIVVINALAAFLWFKTRKKRQK